jgi:hypothetical protein
MAVGLSISVLWAEAAVWSIVHRLGFAMFPAKLRLLCADCGSDLQSVACCCLNLGDPINRVGALISLGNGAKSLFGSVNYFFHLSKKDFL